jgi:hypothetical protein
MVVICEVVCFASGTGESNQIKSSDGAGNTDDG